MKTYSVGVDFGDPRGDGLSVHLNGKLVGEGESSESEMIALQLGILMRTLLCSGCLTRPCKKTTELDQEVIVKAFLDGLE